MKEFFEILFYGSLVIGIWIAVSLWTERTIEYWFDVDLPFWAAMIITFVANGVMFSANIVSEIIRLFM